MSATSSIEWTDATWNPIRGCTRIAAGCVNCYAERMSARGLPGLNSPTTGNPFAVMTPSGPRWTGKVELIESQLEVPLHWKRPRRIFVNSMADTFHESVSLQTIATLFGIMAVAGAHEPSEHGRFGGKYKQGRGWYDEKGPHTFFVLTKRGKRMREIVASGLFQREVSHAAYKWAHDRRDAGYLCDCIYQDRDAAWLAPGRHGRLWPLPNVWLGVSASTRPDLDTQIEHLRATPAAVRFLSLEPLIADLGTINLSGIGWCIVGGESGPGARPMHPDWVRSIRDQCVAAGVPFFFKQRGEWDWDQVDPGFEGESEATPYINLDGEVGAGWVLESDPEVVSNYCGPEPTESSVWLRRIGKKRAGRLLDGREWNELPGVVR